MSSTLYTLLWYKGNAKILFDVQFNPFQWWLYTGLITSYLGLTSWWFFVNNYTIWGAVAITYTLHTAVELGLNFMFFEPPTRIQYVGLGLILAGSALALKLD